MWTVNSGWFSYDDLCSVITNSIVYDILQMVSIERKKGRGQMLETRRRQRQTIRTFLGSLGTTVSHPMLLQGKVSEAWLLRGCSIFERFDRWIKYACQVVASPGCVSVNPCELPVCSCGSICVVRDGRPDGRYPSVTVVADPGEISAWSTRLTSCQACIAAGICICCHGSSRSVLSSFLVTL